MAVVRPDLPTLAIARDRSRPPGAAVNGTATARRSCFAVGARPQGGFPGADRETILAWMMTARPAGFCARLVSRFFLG